MGRPCECCEGGCQTGSSVFNVDRYEAITARSFYVVTEEYYKVVLLKAWGATKAVLSSTKIEDMTKVQTGKDGSLIVMKGSRTDPYKSDSLEEITERGLGEDYGPYDYKFTTYYKKTTVERKIAVEFSIDDVYDWGSEFIKKILLHHQSVDPVTRPGGNAFAYERYNVASFFKNPLRGYRLYGAIVDKVFPKNINQLNNYILESELAETAYSNTFSDITNNIPQKNGKFLFIIDHLPVELKDPITDGPQDQQTGITDNPQEEPVEYDGTAAVFCFDYSSIESGQFLEMFVDINRGGFKSSPETDWHNNFTREAEGVYVSKGSFLNSTIDMGQITSPYFAYGGKLDVEIYSPKAGNKKESAKETYFHETFRYESVLRSFEIQAYYSHECQYDEDGGVVDRLKITNPITDLDRKYFEVIKEAPEYLDPFDDPPNGEYWVHELRLKPEYVDKFSDPATNSAYGEYDSDPCTSSPLFYGYWEYPYKWRAVYGDGSNLMTMAVYQSHIKDNDTLYQKTICDDEDPYSCYNYRHYSYDNIYAGFPCLGQNLRQLYSSAGSCDKTNNSYIHFRIWDCVLETPGAFTEPQNNIQRIGLPGEPQAASSQPKIYYERVPYYGKYKPSKIKLTLLDFKNYDISVQTQDVYNPYTGDNKGCPEVHCLLGPNIPDWQLTSEDFDSAGSPTAHDLIFYGDVRPEEYSRFTAGLFSNECATKIISKKEDHKVGSIKFSFNYSRSEGIYSPTADKVYVLQSEKLDRGYTSVTGGGLKASSDGFSALSSSQMGGIFDFQECVYSGYDWDNLDFNVDFGTWGDVFYGAGPSVPGAAKGGNVCCAVSSFGQSDYWTRRSIGGWRKYANYGQLESCESYVSSVAGSYLVANVQELAYVSEYKYTDVEQRYVEVELDNNFASTHLIYATLEPYVTVDDFAAFAIASKQRQEEGVVELVLGIGYERYSNNEFVDYYGSSTTYRGVNLPKDQLYRAGTYISGSRYSFRVPVYMPGAGLRFRMSNETFSFSVESYFSSSDFDILHQEYIPDIIQDEQLSQEEINKIAGYLIDFDYQYKILGKVFIENPDSENFKEVNGDKVYGDFFENHYFSISPNGEVSEPYVAPKPLIKKNYVAVYDQVDIAIDGSSQTVFAGINCPYENIDSDQESIDCLFARGINDLIRDKSPLREDYSIIDVYSSSTPNTAEYRYKNTKDLSGASNFSLPTSFKTDHKVSSPSRTLVSYGALRNLDSPEECPRQEIDSERTINDGFYTDPGQVVTYAVNIVIPAPDAELSFTDYRIDKIDGGSVEGRLQYGDESLEITDYGTYRTEPSNKFNNEYIRNSQGTVRENVTTEWRDFPISSTVVTALYKKTIKSDDCARFLNLDFGEDDRTISSGRDFGDYVSEDDRPSNIYVQRKTSLWKKTVEDKIWEYYYSGGYYKNKITLEDKYLNPAYVVDGYVKPIYMINYMNSLISSVEYDFTELGFLHGKRTLDENYANFSSYKSYRDLTYPPDYTYWRALNTYSAQENQVLRQFYVAAMPAGNYGITSAFNYVLMQKQTGEEFHDSLSRRIEDPVYKILEIFSTQATISEDGSSISIGHQDVFGRQTDEIVGAAVYVLRNGKYTGPYTVEDYKDTPYPTLFISTNLLGCDIEEQEEFTIKVIKLSYDPEVNDEYCPPAVLSSPHIRDLHEVGYGGINSCSPFVGDLGNLERSDNYEMISLSDYKFTIVKGAVF
jgi:hypothetical protein